MSLDSRPNSWSRKAPQTRSGPSESEWSLKRLSPADDAAFAAVRTNPATMFLATFAKRRTAFLVLGFVLLAASAYFLSHSNAEAAGISTGVWTIGFAAAAIALALLVALGSWLRQLESVEDAVGVLGAPVISVRKGEPDVH